MGQEEVGERCDMRFGQDEGLWTDDAVQVDEMGHASGFLNKISVY